eukprot:CAMPEP_0113682744 /NCGR_PEP_ID=MMETSP0038_2-20120614/12857_1 /TAXON_ID=2898 /ORGANISM="Cryptomonas paramecium" /LENGTH=250 /DNA_ID=CAMNT_0000601895 /DNA_START=112 /DNA_END=861 /DNA_ORIENTATION=- /assembly_acc=CAM_ASM_000170
MARVLGYIHYKGAQSARSVRDLLSLERRRIPEQRHRLYDLKMEMQLNRQWQPRRVVVTKEVVSFSLIGREDELDQVPLHEIDYVKIWRDRASRKSLPTAVTDPGSDTEHGFSLHIATSKSGHNGGRSYYIRSSTKDERDDLLSSLTRLVASAKKRVAAGTIFRRVQLLVRKFYDSSVFQIIMAALIAGNFGCTILETQFIDQMSAKDGSDTPMGRTMNVLNLFFTVVFTAELAVNAFAHYLYPFIYNGWS